MRTISCLIALALILPAQAKVQSRTVPWTERSAAARGEALLRTVILETHNGARKTYGSPPLIWSETLVGRAKTYAETIARTRRFEHDPQANAKPRDGENLAMGTRGAYRYAELVQFWIDERADFVPGRFPDVSRTGDWSRVGHYTQMIWPGTREVGCAMASNAADDVLVCRYAPAGNLVGQWLR